MWDNITKDDPRQAGDGPALTEFLDARYTELERRASTGIDTDPAALLRVAVMRAIIDRHSTDLDPPCETLYLAANEFFGHPQFRSHWHRNLDGLAV